MDVQLESEDLALPSALRREQIGWLAEQELDRAILLGSGGRLQPYLPLFDTRRVDRVYAWDGQDATGFVQAKARSGARTDGRYSWQIPAAHFVGYERYFVVLASIDLRAARLTDPIWLVPSKKVSQVAAQGHDVAGAPVYRITAGVAGKDALAPYRTALDRLWEGIAPPRRPALRPAEAFPVLQEEQGAFYEYAVVVEALRESQDDILLFRAASDVAGRDLLIQRVNSPRALFLQIKGTQRLAERDSIHLLVRRRTFVARANFWLAFYYFDAARGALFDDCWLVPSVTFAQRTATQRDRTTLSFETQLTRGRDRWAEFRVPVRAQGKVLRRTLRAARP
jgi:hypothetical protein